MISIRAQANRLYRYAAKVRKSVDNGDFTTALADTAEAGEISRRLWRDLVKLTNPAVFEDLGRSDK